MEASFCLKWTPQLSLSLSLLSSFTSFSLWLPCFGAKEHFLSPSLRSLLGYTEDDEKSRLMTKTFLREYDPDSAGLCRS